MGINSAFKGLKSPLNKEQLLTGNRLLLIYRVDIHRKERQNGHRTEAFVQNIHTDSL